MFKYTEMQVQVYTPKRIMDSNDDILKLEKITEFVVFFIYQTCKKYNNILKNDIIIFMPRWHT